MGIHVGEYILGAFYELSATRLHCQHPSKQQGKSQCLHVCHDICPPHSDVWAKSVSVCVFFLTAVNATNSPWPALCSLTFDEADAGGRGFDD